MVLKERMTILHPDPQKARREQLAVLGLLKPHNQLPGAHFLKKKKKITPAPASLPLLILLK
jgi:hypothetical protein